MDADSVSSTLTLSYPVWVTNGAAKLESFRINILLRYWQTAAYFVS